MGSAGGETVVLFPGQGSQTRGMRALVERWCPELGEATMQALGTDPFVRVREGTAFAQPAIFCANVAGWRALAQTVEPVAVAGHSLGELAALVAAGSLEPLDALALAIRRGRLMQDAQAARSGGMIAISGASVESVAAVIGRCGVVMANDNSPHQVVLSGSSEALDRARDELAGAGIRAVRLPVCGAFHSPLMAGAGEMFGAALAEIEIRPPRMLALCTTTCAPFADIRRELAHGITRPVLWRQSVEYLYEAGYRRFVEAGPGAVLGKLTSSTLGDSIEVLTVAGDLVAGAVRERGAGDG